MTDPQQHLAVKADPDAARVNQNLDQLLQELRVAVPGVQVLFAFLLIAPFNARFARVAGAGRAWYLGALLAAAGACICLMAPTVHHRILFHQGHKRDLIRVANRLAVVGMGLLAVSITSAIALVATFLYSTVAATAITALAAVALVAVWLGVPLAQLRLPADPTYDAVSGSQAPDDPDVSRRR